MKERLRRALRFLEEPRGIISVIVIVLAIIGIIASAYMLIYYSKQCADEECFKQSIVKCSRAMYTSKDTDMILRYRILGKSGETCKINVALLQLKRGSAELNPLQGKEMLCYLPSGIYMKPEKEIANCHGELREGIQEVIIQRMHSELVENIGEIKAEITEVL